MRREASGLRRYVHLATGNYNATTARLYEDFGYLTAREDIGADVSDLFNVLTGFAQRDTYRGIWSLPVDANNSSRPSTVRSQRIAVTGTGGWSSKSTRW